MSSLKRKRDSRVEDAGSNKRSRSELSPIYAKRAREISEVLSNNANLNVGHVAGLLDAVQRNKDVIALRIKDETTAKILVCEFAAPGLNTHTINMGIGKPIKLSITKPYRVPISSPGREEFNYKLVFDAYQFLLGSELYQDDRGKMDPAWLKDSSDVEEEPVQKPSSPKISKVVPTAPAPLLPRASSSSSSQLPSTWTSVSDAYKREGKGSLTIAGIVRNVSHGPKELDRGWGMELQIIDDSCKQNQYLEVKIYAKKKVYLPPIDVNESGMAILISGLVIKNKPGKVWAQASSTYFRYACFPDDNQEPYVRDLRGQDETTFKDAPVYRWTEPELAGLRRLTAWYKGDPMPSSSQGRENSAFKYLGTHKLIRDVGVGDFFDCTVELLKKWDGGPADTCIYVTDYTVNPLLSGMDKKSLLRGCRTMRIQLWDLPALQIGGLTNGYVYRLNNVRMTKRKGYTNVNCGNFDKGTVENPICQVERGDEHYIELQRRKRLYESGTVDDTPTEQPTKATQKEAEKPEKSSKGNSSTKPVQSSSSSSPSAPDSRKPASQDVLDNTANPAAATTSVVPDEPEPEPEPKIRKEYAAFPLVLGPEDEEPSDVVQCRSLSSHPLSTLQDIELCPINPAMFRFRGRIVDIEPSDLRDAVIRFCTQCLEVCDGNKCPTCRTEAKVEYHVRLQITFQDASGELPVKFAHETAIKFFRLSTRTRHDKDQLLKQLSQRFQVLMGLPVGDKYSVGGLSEIFELVVRSWQIQAQPVRPVGPGSTRWVKCLAPSGCSMTKKEV